MSDRAAEELDALPALLPPEGVVASRLREVAARAVSLGVGRLDVAGVSGCAAAAPGVRLMAAGGK